MGTVNVAYGKVGLGGSAGTLPPIITVESAENVTTNASTSVPSVAAASNTGNVYQGVVRVLADEDIYVKVGAGTPVADKTTSTLVKADIEAFFSVNADHKIAMIDSA